MKHTLTSYDFVNRFTEIRPDNFSRAALFALFDYYGELEQFVATGPNTNPSPKLPRLTDGNVQP
jgi:hypothetical protein